MEKLSKDNSIQICGIENVEKFASAERFMKTLKNKVLKYMTLLLEMYVLLKWLVLYCIRLWRNCPWFKKI